MHTPPLLHHRGLTVIETMVVVAIAAVLAALAAPSMINIIAAQRVKGINAEIVTDLQFARSEAARRNRDVLIRFRPAPENCYTVFVPEGGAIDCNCSLTPGLDVCSGTSEEMKTVQIPASTGVSLDVSVPPKIIFEGKSGGSRVVDVNDTFTVTVSSSVHGQLRTTVNAAGRPTICSPDSSISSVPPC